MNFVVRFFGLMAWLTAIALTIVLVREFTEDQDIVVTGIAYLAIGLSALGLVMARHSWTKRAFPEIAIGLAMWIAGVGSLTFMEVSYWISSYEVRFEHYADGKKAKARQDAKGDKAWDALLTGSVAANSAQIEAQLKAKRLDPAVERSGNCQKVTRDDSRRVCGEFFALEAQLAGARQRETLEAQIKVDAPEAQKRLSNNVFAAAELLARYRGGEVRDWAYMIMLWSWALLMLVRDGGLLVANPLGRQRKPQAAARLEPVRNTDRLPRPAQRPDLARTRTAVAASDEALDRIADAQAKILADINAKMKSVPSNAKGETQTALLVSGGTQTPFSRHHDHDPGTGGSGNKAKIAEVENGIEPEDRDSETVVRFPVKAEVKGARQTVVKKAKGARSHGDIRDWLKARTLFNEHDTTLTPAGVFYDDYLQWCDEYGRQPLGNKKLTRVIKAKFRMEKHFGKIRRNVGGQNLLPGLSLKDAEVPRWQIEKRRASA